MEDFDAFSYDLYAVTAVGTPRTVPFLSEINLNGSSSREARATAKRKVYPSGGPEPEKITRRHSEDLRKELARLENLRLQTIVRIGSEDEVNEAKQSLKADKNDSKKRKRTGDGGYVWRKKSNIGRV